MMTNWLSVLLKWISMCNKNVQQKIKESFVKEEAKQEEEEEEIVVEEEEEEKDTQEPHVPAGSSFEKEEPAPPECSSEKEESGEKKTDIQDDETAPEVKPAHSILLWSRYHWKRR